MLSKGWVKLQIEPVEVTIDNEDSLLFSTVQSVVPGAHGLYYRENGQRKALGFDTNTGRVFAPPNGWLSQDIFVHLAHGTRHGMHYADYNKATTQFEKNVAAVQKLFAAAGMGYSGLGAHKPTVRGEKKTRSRSKVKSGFEAQPENVHISEESDVVAQTTTEQEAKTGGDFKTQLQELKKQNEKLKRRSSGEVTSNEQIEAELKKLRERNLELESKLASLNTTDDSHKEASVEQVASQGENSEIQVLLAKLAEKDEEINNLHNVIEELRQNLTVTKKEKSEFENSLSESNEKLKNAKDKISYLENELNILISPPDLSTQKIRSRKSSESQDDSPTKVRSLETKLQLANNQIRVLESDKQKLQEANWYANERIGKVEKEIGYLKGLNEEMRNRLADSTNAQLLAERDQRIADLAEQRSKLEWRLGELNQWWNDSKWKIGELEANVAHQKYLLETAGNKIENLNEQTPQAPVYSVPTYSVQQNVSGQWQLANARLPFIAPPAQPHFIPSYSSCPPPVQPAYGYQSLETRRVVLEIENPDQSEVFVLSSFLNWQCAVRCDVNNNGKSGIILDLPRGKHEFRFMKNGAWATSSLYAAAPNGYGGFNNIIIVE